MQRKLLYFSLLTCLSVFVFFAVARSTFAAPMNFTEDFSNGFTKWQIARGSMSLWSIEGQQAKATVNSYSTLTEIIPKDEYWNPNWKDISYTFEYTPIQGTDRNISFGYQNTLNWYDLHFVDTFLELARVQNGIVTFSFDRHYVLENGRTYQMRLVMEHGRIQFYVDQDMILDTVDWTFNQNFGKISLKATAGYDYPTIVQFDNIIVAPLLPPEVQTHVPLIKQNDPAWRNEIYDQAHIWASDDPSIKRWGCALTSMTMVMRFYGMDRLPDGQNLTPATLNTWLIAQRDGYLNSGDLNWSAVTRLVKKIHDVYGTVKLEHKSIGADSEKLKGELLASRPTIVGIPGHFLVADGISANRQDVHIADPGYTFTNFTQHNKEITSLHAFLPSNTDLSALVLNVPANFALEVTDANGQAIPDAIMSTEFLADPELESAHSPSTTQFFLAKPPTGEYLAKITRLDAPSQGELKIFAYDAEANFADLSQPLPFAKSKTWQISFTPTSSTIKPLLTFAQFRQELADAHHDRTLFSYYAYYHLDRIAGFTENATLAQQQRYLQLLRSYLEQFQTEMTPEAFANFQSDLITLGLV